MNVDSINSVAAYNPYNSVNQSMASGKQINNAADDPAGLAVATGMNSQILEQSMGMRNANDGISMLQTADGTARGMTVSVQRMYELSVQSMSGTLNASQRNILNMEFQQNLQEMNRMASTTQFNGMNLFDGSNSDINIALGGSNNNVNLPNLTASALGIDSLDISDMSNAGLAMEALMQAQDTLSSTQAEFGAQQNRMYSAVSNMAINEQNTQASMSQIMDTDYARAATERARNDVLAQAGLMMQAQGNQDRANVLQLIN